MSTEEAIEVLLLSDQPVVVHAAKAIQQHYERRNKILKFVQEALSQLHLEIKFLLFDLEVTRRERDALINEQN